jgi:hypothetical protein
MNTFFYVMFDVSIFNIISGSCEKTKTYFNGNCSIMGIMLRSDEFTLVIPPNNQHLAKLNDKLSLEQMSST